MTCGQKQLKFSRRSAYELEKTPENGGNSDGKKRR